MELVQYVTNCTAERGSCHWVLRTSKTIGTGREGQDGRETKTER